MSTAVPRSTSSLRWTGTVSEPFAERRQTSWPSASPRASASTGATSTDGSPAITRQALVVHGRGVEEVVGLRREHEEGLGRAVVDRAVSPAAGPSGAVGSGSRPMRAMASDRSITLAIVLQVGP